MIRLTIFFIFFSPFRILNKPSVSYFQKLFCDRLQALSDLNNSLPQSIYHPVDLLFCNDKWRRDLQRVSQNAVRRSQYAASNDDPMPETLGGQLCTEIETVGKGALFRFVLHKLQH